LLANTTAAIFGCRRFSKLLNQPLVLSTLFCVARIAERAPWISDVRKYASFRPVRDGGEHLLSSSTFWWGVASSPSFLAWVDKKRRTAHNVDADLEKVPDKFVLRCARRRPGIGLWSHASCSALADNCSYIRWIYIAYWPITVRWCAEKNPS